MAFREIDNYDYVFEKVPFAIRSIFKWNFGYSKMYQRFIKLEGDNYKSYALYLDWKYFEKEIREKKVFDENGKAFTNESIESYLKGYSDGFVKGYYDLDNEIKETTSIFQVSNIEIADKVFKITNIQPTPFSFRRFLSIRGKRFYVKRFFYRKKNINSAFRETEKPIMTRIDLENEAQKVGRYYKAWFFIMNNPDLFIDLFKSFHLESYKLIEKELKERNSHHPNYETELQSIIDNFEKLTKPNPKPLQTKTFEGLFIKPYNNNEKILEFINILKEVTPPLITPNNSWVSTGLKGAMQMFFIALDEKGVIKIKKTKAYAKIIDSKFEGIGIHFLDAGGHNKDASDLYGEEFEERINRLLIT